MQPQRMGLLDAAGRVSTRLQRPLLRRGYVCDVLDHPASIERYCTCVHPSAMLLSGGEAEEVLNQLRAIRGAGYSDPVLVLHDNHLHPAIIESLACGADDAIPVDTPLDLMMDRIDLVLRHAGVSDTPQPDLAHFYSALTPMENDILTALCNAQPGVLTREDIMWSVRRRRIEPDDRTLDVYISSIRRKIRLTRAEISIQTVRGKGFRYCDGIERR